MGILMENPEKRWYYVTVEKVVSWSVAVEAGNEQEAAREAEEAILGFDQADYVYEPQAVNVEEVKRFVE